MVSRRDREVLNDYWNETPIVDGDGLVLEDYASMDYVNLGFNKDGEPTAKLTQRGREIVLMETPIRKFFRVYASLLY